MNRVESWKLLKIHGTVPTLKFGYYTVPTPEPSRRRSGPISAMGTGLRRYGREAKGLSVPRSDHRWPDQIGL